MPGIPDVALQQSGQSGDESKTAIENQKEIHSKRIQQLIFRILDEKMNENVDICVKMGALEVLQSLLKKKMYY